MTIQSNNMQTSEKELQNIRDLLCSDNNEDVILGVLMMIEGNMMNKIMNNRDIMKLWDYPECPYTNMFNGLQPLSSDGFVIIRNGNLIYRSSGTFMGLAKKSTLHLFEKVEILYTDGSITYSTIE